MILHFDMIAIAGMFEEFCAQDALSGNHA